MSHGFLATNDSGQVLISSETRNLHFVGKARLHAELKSESGYGGMRRWNFWIDCMVTPVPFFTMPTNDRYGVSAVRQVQQGLWEIEIIRSGSSASIPEVYVFADPRAVTPTENYGMQVFRDDGTPSFDSRMSPLAVIGGTYVSPPPNPLVASPGGLSAQYCNSNAGVSMGPDSERPTGLNLLASKPMFFFPSIAQAQRQVNFSQEEKNCVGFDAYGGCVGYGTQKNWDSHYWAFYRSGIRYAAGAVYCGWVTVEYGCNWTYREENSLIGIGLGGNSGAAGSWPYNNETLNLQSTAVIVGDASKYD